MYWDALQFDFHFFFAFKFKCKTKAQNGKRMTAKRTAEIIAFLLLLHWLDCFFPFLLVFFFSKLLVFGIRCDRISFVVFIYIFMQSPLNRFMQSLGVTQMCALIRSYFYWKSFYFTFNSMEFDSKSTLVSKTKVFIWWNDFVIWSAGEGGFLPYLG